ncbi:membrane protein of unknown function [Modestobacter italicus]|uniref:Uncharacterized protein n=1 Tax=Modestobacter italicus (strain DSM 44449 / CECT 9708 / BC 501) TaxID=2732864 RepID=I4EX91_MODI5|nr:hypothetical protein [Modestobacter marinus]CCH88004.1 membrane protein of unknown function [Modestobacter marinus]
MIAAWVAIAFFLVVLPLGAWWLGGRSFLDRPNAAAEAAALGRTVAQRHGLRPVQAALVQKAVTWGHRLEEPALRAAAVDLAEQVIDAHRRRRAARPALSGLLVVVLALWLSFVVARLVFAVAAGRWGDVNWSTAVLYAACGWWAWRLHSGPRRAVERNSDPVPR